jgi:hypothetical protein
VGETEFPQEFADATHTLVGLSFIEVENGHPDDLGSVHAAKLRHFGETRRALAVTASGKTGAGGGPGGFGGRGRLWRPNGLRVPFDDLVEVVFEAISDGNDLFAYIDLVAGDRVDMGEGDDEGAVNADEFL